MRDVGSIPGLGRYLGEGKGYHSSALVWRIPWTVKWGQGASAGGEWLKNKGPGSSYLTCFAAEPSGWSLCFVSSTHFAHCFSDLLLQQLLTLLCPCVRTQWLSAFCSFLAGSLWLPRQSLKFWRPARLRQPVGLGLNAAINSPSALNALWNFPVFVL